MTVSQSPLRSKCWAVILAAGKDSFERNNVPTSYAALAGANVVKWATAPFLSHPSIEAVVLVVAQGDGRWQANGPRSDKKPIWTTQGGEHRCHSCFGGLQRLETHAKDNDWVIVHDAVRPCLSVDDLDRFINKLAGDDVGGVTAVPLRGTLKSQAEPGVIKQTLTAEGLWRAQTPQMFRFRMLKTALSHAVSLGVLPSDESHAMELAGHRPKMLEGNSANIELTSSQHLALAEAILAGRGNTFDSNAK